MVLKLEPSVPSEENSANVIAAVKPFRPVQRVFPTIANAPEKDRPQPCWFLEGGRVGKLYMAVLKSEPSVLIEKIVPTPAVPPLDVVPYKSAV